MNGLPTRLRMVKKWNQTPGDRPPARPPGVFFFGKKGVYGNNYVYVSEKGYIYAFFYEKLIML